MQHALELPAMLLAEQAQKIDASQFLAEIFADLGSGEPEAEAEQARAFGDEGLGQQGRNPRRFDFEPVRRNAAIAYAIPIRVKLPTRRLLHNPTRRKTLHRGPAHAHSSASEG